MKIIILTILVSLTNIINAEINVLSSCNQADNSDGLPNLNISVHINIGGSNQNVIKDESCGVTIPSKTGGEPYEGQFPFNVAIYKSTFSSTSYECQGILISKNVVLTSAICMTSGQPRDLKRFVLYMGKYNFLSWERAVQRSIKNLVLHPKFDPATYYADLAILKLDRNVVFTDYIRPSCLWNKQTDINSLVGMEGTVPGWEYDPEVYNKEELSPIKMRIASPKECVLNSYLKKTVTTTDSLFCAGYKTTVVCKGDDGAGLFFQQDGKWYLRGVNSISIGYQDEVICDSNHFAAFTDVVPFIQWIESYL